ncbi:insulinase family protein [Candidatus Parcubacteria bacterium]|nr:insulinase family protein [Candidatus Parcubacteria bacterium]
MWDPYAQFESATLPNGLRVHNVHWPGRPWVKVEFLVHGGTELDPVGREGLSHFVEHMVSKNGPESYSNMREFFEDTGGSVSFGATDHLSTCYDFSVPADKAVLTRAFNLFGRILIGARLEKLLEHQRSVITAEFHQCFPEQFEIEALQRESKALYSGWWLERFLSAIGTLPAIAAINQDDLQSHYDAYYVPANIELVCVGGLTAEELLGLLAESQFAADKPGKRVALPVPVDEVNLPAEILWRFSLSDHIKTSEPLKTGYYRSIALIPGPVQTAVMILRVMLDELLDARMRQQLAWNYESGCSWYNYRYFHKFAMSCKALPLASLETIEAEVEACISSVRDQRTLFEKIKRRAIAQMLIKDPNGESVRGGAISDLVQFGRIISFKEMGQQFEMVQMQDVCALLKWLVPERRFTIIRRP